MAKKKSKESIHTHIPSHIAFGIIALVVLAFGLIVVTQYNTNNQTQTAQTHAAAAKTPLVQPKNPVSITATNSKQCISYNVEEKCILYQTTTTTVNTKSPCISYNTSGKCTYYQNTTQTTKTFVPTQVPPKKCHNVTTCTFSKPGKCLASHTVQVCN